MIRATKTLVFPNVTVSPVMLTVSPACKEILLAWISFALPACTSIVPEPVCNEIRAPSGGVVDAELYCTIFPLITLSRATS